MLKGEGGGWEDKVGGLVFVVSRVGVRVGWIEFRRWVFFRFGCSNVFLGDFSFSLGFFNW